MVQKSLSLEKGVWHINGWTADKILALLEEKHLQDVFIPECKNGKSWGADFLRLDAWAMKRSWSPLTIIGYEIKVSRQDFEQDQKWTGYLDVCHTFNFVCPAGLIRAYDLPDGVGLIWVSTTGKLVTKRKPVRRQPDVNKLNQLLTYVVMSRAKITANMNDTGEPPPDKLMLLREAVERANERKELAYFIRGHIREQAERISKLDNEMGIREDKVKRFEERLAKLGITWDSTAHEWFDTNRVENEIDELKKRIDNRNLQTIKRLAADLVSFVDYIERFR